MKKTRLFGLFLILFAIIIFLIEYIFKMNIELLLSIISIIVSLIIITNKKHNYLTIIKNILTIILLIYISISYKNIYYLSFGILEYSIITLVLDRKKNNVIHTILSSIIYFLFYIQEIILLFGGSYISMIMLSNISSLEDLSNNFIMYGLGILIVIILSTIRMTTKYKTKRKILLILTMILFEVFMFNSISYNYSPIANYSKLVNQYNKYFQYKAKIKKNAKLYNAEKYYKENIENYILYDNSVGENPNIILFFTEGMSKSIMFDNRNITPTLQDYYYKSISFDNYYNHTAATYRGIVGQLYSSYQLENNDKNLLISIQNILENYGYNTTFINTEPENEEFVAYLESFEFQNLVTYDKREGGNNSIKDSDAYNYLYEKALELNKGDKPFFLSMYSYGTHVAHDSLDYKFEDGSNPELNKFYNLDMCFKDFIEKFNNSELFDNTIIVFTADHATYTDKAWADTFDVRRYDDFTDEIPLMIYHKGVQPRIINVDGRNSLDLAPTILDYIDISSPNYFLGNSLFSTNNVGTKFDTTSTYLMNYISTKNDQIKFIGYDDPVVSDILEYAAIASKEQ